MTARAPKLTPAQRVQLGAKLREEYEAGSSIRDLAATHGRDYGSIRALLHEAGTAIRPTGWQAGRKRPTGRDITHLRGLLERACDALPDRELADRLRQEGGIAMEG